MRGRPLVVSLTVLAMIVCAVGASAGFAAQTSRVHAKKVKAIHLGELGDLSGNGALQWGQALHNGEVMAIDEVTRAKVLNGFKLVLHAGDEASTPSLGITLYQKYVDAGYKFIMADAYSPTLNAIGASRITGNKTLMMSAAAGTTVSAPGYVYRMNDPAGPISNLAKYVVQTRHASKIGLVVDTSYAAFTAAAQAFDDALKALGAPSPVVRIDLSGTETDFSSTLTTLRQKGVDAAVLLVIPQTGGNILRQMSVFGGFDNVARLGWLAWSSAVWSVAGSTATGSVFPQAWVPTQANSKAFVRSYRTRFQQDPSTYAAFGHDMMWLTAVAMAQARAKHQAINGTNVGKQIPSASRSKLFQKHALISGFSMGANGVPLFPGVLATFNSNGQVIVSK